MTDDYDSDYDSTSLSSDYDSMGESEAADWVSGSED